LWLVRHGESASNLAWEHAEASEHHQVRLVCRDVDLALSELGERQSAALGRWLAALPPQDRPTALFASPHLRTRRTAEIARAAAGLSFGVEIDERLREKEFGVMDGLTKRGIRERLPELDARRRKEGKFYYRPPGGESWCDVVLRLRSFWTSLALERSGDRVLVVAHQVVIYCMRYVLEKMTEEQILQIDRTTQIRHCAVTAYTFGKRSAHLVCFNDLVIASEP
jgi:broad specificity phosphatase PhoE